MENDFKVRISISFVILLLAAFRFVFYDIASKRMDDTFLLLFIGALLIPILPWHKISEIKALGVEVGFVKKQVQGAITGIQAEEGINMHPIDQKKLGDTIEAMAEDINQVKGSRILWIDDNPLTILGERRLLRALGLQIVMEADSENARMRLKNDSDFDLIISDLQRTAKTDKKVTIHDGALFVKEIRQDSMHPAIKNIPIIIYSAFREASVNILKDKGVTHFENIELCDTIETLLTKVILTLVQVRNNPIKVESRKKVTSPQ